MNVAVIGTGGREHSIARKCTKSEKVEKVYVVPGNSGMTMDEKLNLHTYKDWDGSFISLYNFLIQEEVELVVIGNESYLEQGIVDFFSKKDIKVFGPNQEAALLESSKNLAKEFMKRHNIPTANFQTVSNYEAAVKIIEETDNLVIKQDGLALGKGVLVTSDKLEAKDFVEKSFRIFDKLVFEEFLVGPEFSLLAFVNDGYVNTMIPARDYKRALDNDQGKNTGGMGAYAPVEYINDEDLAYCKQHIVEPTVSGLVKDGVDFKGILYFGLMKTNDGIKVIEYNTRFGDPEAEVLLEAMESDLVEVIDATFKKEEFDIKWKDGVTLGVCLASTGYPSEYKKGEKVELTKDINCYSMALASKDSYYTNEGGRVLFVVDNAPSIDEVRSKVYRNIETIKSDNLYYRKDIGK